MKQFTGPVECMLVHEVVGWLILYWIHIDVMAWIVSQDCVIHPFRLCCHLGNIAC